VTLLCFSPDCDAKKRTEVDSVTILPTVLSQAHFSLSICSSVLIWYPHTPQRYRKWTPVIFMACDNLKLLTQCLLSPRASVQGSSPESIHTASVWPPPPTTQANPLPLHLHEKSSESVQK
jgi:hypothetical protein